MQLRTFLIDFFHNETVEAISPLGLERVLLFTASPDGWDAASATQPGGKKVYMRQYAVQLKKSAEGTSPYVDLVEMGPSADLRCGRPRPASLWHMHSSSAASMLFISSALTTQPPTPPARAACVVSSPPLPT